MSIPDESPLFIPDPADEPLLGTSRARANRARKGDMTAVWIIIGIAGLCGVGYALYFAIDDTSPPPPAPAQTTAAAPVTPTEDNFGDETVRREALRHRLEAKRKRAVPLRETVLPNPAPEPPAEVVVEPERPAPAPETPEAFNDGSAFDRPSVDSSRIPRRRGSSRDFGSYQAPNSDRPNQPDPSFDEPPSGRPATRKGENR